MINPHNNFEPQFNPPLGIESGMPPATPQKAVPEKGLPAGTNSEPRPPRPEMSEAEKRAEALKVFRETKAAAIAADLEKEEAKKNRAAAFKNQVFDESDARLAIEQRTERLNRLTDEWARAMIDKGFPLSVGINSPENKQDLPRYIGGRIDAGLYSNVLGIGSKLVEKHRHNLERGIDLTPGEIEKIKINRLSTKEAPEASGRTRARHARQMSMFELNKILKGEAFIIGGSEWDACKNYADMIMVDPNGNILAAFETRFEGAELGLADKKLREELFEVNVKKQGTRIVYGLVPNPSKLPTKKPAMIKSQDYNVPVLKIIWPPDKLKILADSFLPGKAISDEEQKVIDEILADFYVQIDDIKSAQEVESKKTGRPKNQRFEDKLKALDGMLKKIKPRESLLPYQEKTAQRNAQAEALLGMTGKPGRPPKVKLGPPKKYRGYNRDYNN